MPRVSTLRSMAVMVAGMRWNILCALPAWGSAGPASARWTGGHGTHAASQPQGKGQWHRLKVIPEPGQRPPVVPGCAPEGEPLVVNSNVPNGLRPSVRFSRPHTRCRSAPWALRGPPQGNGTVAAPETRPHFRSGCGVSWVGLGQVWLGYGLLGGLALLLWLP